MLFAGPGEHIPLVISVLFKSTEMERLKNFKEKDSITGLIGPGKCLSLSCLGPPQGGLRIRELDQGLVYFFIIITFLR